MERITMSLEPELAQQFDSFIRDHRYSNRSEALRDLIRERLDSDRLQTSEDGYCVATLSYVYNHHELELAARITSAHHDHHDMTLSSTHIHLDHDNCLEVVMLRGGVSAVRDFANSVMASRGVRHGRLNMIPVEINWEVGAHAAEPHAHSYPKT
ncbi:MAG: CopG family transcriptional regulator nickel-responsive regulator [Gammaproteobacteria bacterium]|nr:MAG: CopG family transcriptional regulator nickel-responsive regulator [Gammaproteobacteria bacterium]TND06381.1 MAG: CopG family transcriptional regulator, nickel-responsive regulator [Gammaproteobacteria bacterium]